MKVLPLLFLTAFLVIPCLAQAEGVHVLITDKDPQGTNVRSAPSGKLVATIPLPAGPNDERALERRSVIITGQRGSWFSVFYDGGKEGWMHKSVLGTCAAATEDGNPHLKIAPNDDAREVGVFPNGTRLTISGFYQGRDAWLEVTGSDGSRQITGWLPEHCLFSNPYNSCWDTARSQHVGLLFPLFDQQP